MSRPTHNICFTKRDCDWTEGPNIKGLGLLVSYKKFFFPYKSMQDK